MKLKELKQEIASIDNVEFYRYSGLGRGVHTDNLEYLDISSCEELFSNREEIDLDVFIMGEEEYDKTICANSHFCWGDAYQSDEKCAIIIVKN